MLFDPLNGAPISFTVGELCDIGLDRRYLLLHEFLVRQGGVPVALHKPGYQQKHRIVNDIHGKGIQGDDASLK
jgi:hypothetical protein